MVYRAENDGRSNRSVEFKAFFKHMDYSEALADYSEKKLVSCAATYLRRGGVMNVTFAVEGGRHSVHLHLTGSVDVALHGESHESEGMYACVDRLQDKLDETLRRRKEKWTNHHGEGDHWEERERLERLAAKQGESSEPEVVSGDPALDVVDAAYVINYERARVSGST